MITAATASGPRSPGSPVDPERDYHTRAGVAEGAWARRARGRVAHGAVDDSLGRFPGRGLELDLDAGVFAEDKPDALASSTDDRLRAGSSCHLPPRRRPHHYGGFPAAGAGLSLDEQLMRGGITDAPDDARRRVITEPEPTSFGRGKGNEAGENRPAVTGAEHQGLVADRGEMERFVEGVRGRVPRGLKGATLTRWGQGQLISPAADLRRSSPARSWRSQVAPKYHGHGPTENDQVPFSRMT